MPAWSQAADLLRTYRGRRGDHEGIVFLLGVRPSPETQVITTAVAPEADHGPEHVICNEEQMLAVTLAGRAHHIALLGQLHSHPTGWTEHSPGDDHLVFMPRESMSASSRPTTATPG